VCHKLKAHLVVIPDGNPREAPMAELQVQIAPVSSMALAVVVQGVDNLLRLRDAVNGRAISVVAITSIFVDVVAELGYSQLSVRL
jgi:hypothetical protein